MGGRVKQLPGPGCDGERDRQNLFRFLSWGPAIFTKPAWSQGSSIVQGVGVLLLNSAQGP